MEEQNHDENPELVNKTKKGKIRIEFSVSDPETERYVTFADDVWPTDVKEWFVRASLGVEQLFRLSSTCVIMLDPDCQVVQKIQCIKLVRMFTNCGLKEAKDLVERNSPLVPTPGILFLCEKADCKNIDTIIRKFAEIGGTKVNARPAEFDMLMNGKIPKFDASRPVF